ncbi:hypothetical protein M5K25_001678 [Dendrobium thyrsiflorum]|uniref:Autophagy protein 5 n=1 Tax=Dendrobium thyrsiflorum TaxID=117978 RepID=A0ABD0VS16_DENTH
MELCSEEAVRLVWEGAIPLQIHLHESEVTTLPPPPPVLILGPRIGYLPLLVTVIKPHFNDTLPPGVDSVWFDYKGLPLKWYIPTGVLFDLLCAEPERPWNLTVHFRGNPGEILTPCGGEDPVKWSFINSLKEAAYIINGNCKNVMNMSQTDQSELWQSLAKGNMESYTRVSSRLKLGPYGEDAVMRMSTGRIPIRLYLRILGEDVDDLEDVTTIDSWDSISYINRPVEIHNEEGHYITFKNAMRSLLPEFFDDETSAFDHVLVPRGDYEIDGDIENAETSGASGLMTMSGQKKCTDFVSMKSQSPKKVNEIKLIRVQGIEVDLDIPFFWVVNNLKNPEYFLHICVFMVPALNPA